VWYIKSFNVVNLAASCRSISSLLILLNKITVDLPVPVSTTHYNILQHTATPHCNTLQHHTATYCHTTLHYTDFTSVDGVYASDVFKSQLATNNRTSKMTVDLPACCQVCYIKWWWIWLRIVCSKAGIFGEYLPVLRCIRIINSPKSALYSVHCMKTLEIWQLSMFNSVDDTNGGGCSCEFQPPMVCCSVL